MTISDKASRGVASVTVSAKASRGVIGVTTSAKHPEGSLCDYICQGSQRGHAMFRTALLPSTATPAWKADITVLVNEHDSGKPDSHTRLLSSPCPSLSNFAIKLLTFAPLLCFHLYVACVQMYVCGHTCV